MCHENVVLLQHRLSHVRWIRFLSCRVLLADLTTFFLGGSAIRKITLSKCTPHALPSFHSCHQRTIGKEKILISSVACVRSLPDSLTRIFQIIFFPHGCHRQIWQSNPYTRTILPIALCIFFKLQQKNGVSKTYLTHYCYGYDEQWVMVVKTETLHKVDDDK